MTNKRYNFVRSFYNESLDMHFIFSQHANISQMNCSNKIYLVSDSRKTTFFVVKSLA